MGFFKSAKKMSGWLAFHVQTGGISAAAVRRPPGALPVVEAVAYSATGQAGQGAALERIGKDLHAGRYKCSNLLAANEYQLLSVDAPNVPPDELKTAMRWRLKDMLDYRVDDATVDVFGIPGDRRGSARTAQMYAVAARNQLIQQRQALFETARVPLQAIDIPEMGQRNIAALMETEGRGVAMLSFGDDGGLLTISFSGELYLSRRIDVAADQLDHPDENVRQSASDRITLELQRSLDHFDRQYHFITLSRLVLAPLVSGQSALQEYLGANLQLPVESLQLDTILDLAAAPALKSSAEQQRHLLAIGAALRTEEKAL
ncbi:MAG TPA: agglutinin biogenesis protein MshI [Noviherbaspirillum sp.]|jgi:MSHA biogenesis protein MshI|uniref:agglutinin biogenesis protein MshI n=1 Tax=Noviherbaspirillum sp. TaxID=1926288 RepID=UPI002F931EF5